MTNTTVSEELRSSTESSSSSVRSNVRARSRYIAYITSRDASIAEFLLDNADDQGELEAAVAAAAAAGGSARDSDQMDDIDEPSDHEHDELNHVNWAHRLDVMKQYEAQHARAFQGMFFNTEPLPFVNREEEVAEFVTCLVDTQATYQSGNAYILHSEIRTPFLDQMFGSGKTTLALRALEYAKNGLELKSPDGVPRALDDYGRAICDKLFPDHITAGAVKRKCRALDLVLQSAVCHIRFRNLHDWMSAEGPSSAFKSIAHSLDVPEIAIDGIKVFVSGMHAIARYKKIKSILLIIDEVYDASVEDISNMWSFLIREARSLGSSFDPIALNVAFCGRQTLFLTLGKGDYSPTSISWIVLPSLKLEHIRQIVSKFSRLPVPSFRRKEVEDHFYNRLLDTTGGVPRMLEYVLNALAYLFMELQLDKSRPLHLIAKEEVDFILDDIIFHGFCICAPDRDKYSLDRIFDSLIPAGKRLLLQSALGMLLLSAETGQELNIETEVGENILLGHLINRLPVFLDKGNHYSVKIQQSQYLLRILQKESSERVPAFQTLLTFISARCGPVQHGDATQDPASLFELMLTARMSQSFEASRLSGEPLQLPGIDFVLRFMNRKVDSFTVPHGTRIEFGVWPKVAERGKKRRASTTSTSSTSSSFDDDFVRIISRAGRLADNVKECTPEQLSQEIFRLITSGQRDRVYLFLVRGKSGSADFYIVSLCDPTMVIGVQAKSGYSETIGPTKICDEWLKFKATCPQDTKSVDVQFVLIVAAMQYSQEVDKAIEYANGVLHLATSRRYFLGSRKTRCPDTGKEQDVTIGLASVSLDELNGATLHRRDEHNIYRIQEECKQTNTRKTISSKSLIALPITIDRSKAEVCFEVFETTGYSGKYDKWVELLPDVEDTSPSYHIVLWSKSKITGLLGEDVMKEFHTVKTAVDDPMGKIDFLGALLTPSYSLTNQTTAPQRPDNNAEFTLRVSGTNFPTTYGTLISNKSTYFKDLFTSGKYKEMLNDEGQVVIDGDATRFRMIMEHLYGNESAILRYIDRQSDTFELDLLLGDVERFGVQKLVKVVKRRLDVFGQ